MKMNRTSSYAYGYSGVTLRLRRAVSGAKPMGEFYVFTHRQTANRHARAEKP